MTRFSIRNLAFGLAFGVAILTGVPASAMPSPDLGGLAAASGAQTEEVRMRHHGMRHHGMRHHGMRHHSMRHHRYHGMRWHNGMRRGHHMRMMSHPNKTM